MENWWLRPAGSARPVCLALLEQSPPITVGALEKRAGRAGPD